MTPEVGTNGYVSMCVRTKERAKQTARKHEARAISDWQPLKEERTLAFFKSLETQGQVPPRLSNDGQGRKSSELLQYLRMNDKVDLLHHSYYGSS